MTSDDHRIEAAIASVADSSLFDERAYAVIAGVAGSRAELLRHYVRLGEMRGLCPSAAFNPSFYGTTYPDLRDQVFCKLEHYVLFGRHEGRYPSQAQLREDALLLEQSHLVDEMFLMKQLREFDFKEEHSYNKFELYLLSRSSEEIINRRFESEFYKKYYPDVPRFPGAALVHYLRFGRAEERLCTEFDFRERVGVLGSWFDPQHYLAQLPDHSAVENPVEHYILFGERMRLEPSSEFSPDYYLRRHPDLVGSGMSPFYHFIKHGIAERRQAKPNYQEIIVDGDRQFDAAKPTIAVICHEATKTGAPLLGLLVGRHLAERFNVVAGLGSGGEMTAEFLRSSFAGIRGNLDALDGEFVLRDLLRKYDLQSVVLNSVETSAFAIAALNAEIPSVGLIHEFAEYTFPVGRMTSMVECVDETIVPAQIVCESTQREVFNYRNAEANSVSVRAQGYLPYRFDRKNSEDLTLPELLRSLRIDPNKGAIPIVFGSGFIHIRKGVDLFIQTAAECRKVLGDQIRFVWVGAGYFPFEDPNYSAWLHEMVVRLELEDIVHFIPHQGSLANLYSVSSVFYLSSRLDPFPNVALDSIKIGKPVVCFDRATGIAEHLGPGKRRGEAVRYCDVVEAAAAIIRHLESSDAPVAVMGSDEEFSFDSYVQFIESKMESAKVKREVITTLANAVLASGEFDAKFHDGSALMPTEQDAFRSALVYAARATKNLSLFNPRAGSHEGLLRGAPGQLSTSNGQVLRQNTRPLNHGTHIMFRLDSLRDGGSRDSRVALHIHLHYEDLAEEFLERLNEAALPIDLYVTTNNSRKMVEIQYTFRNYRFGELTVFESPNLGRDIGPFLTNMPETFMRDYDIVGHMHGKKSLGVDRSGAMGDRWREFSLDCLLPGKPLLGRILGIFEQHPEIGLLFSEDRHCSGWGRNKSVAVALAERMTQNVALPDHPIFPLGNMFWARRSVAKPLWDLKLRDDDLPPEPLPNDGTIAHAVERILPSVCESVGLSWATVYRENISW